MAATREISTEYHADARSGGGRENGSKDMLDNASSAADYGAWHHGEQSNERAPIDEMETIGAMTATLQAGEIARLSYMLQHLLAHFGGEMGFQGEPWEKTQMNPTIVVES